MVVGFCISLDPPGAFSTGLCIAHAVLPKEAWLEHRGVLGKWPCWGFPSRIHLDNAKQFHGEMLLMLAARVRAVRLFLPVPSKSSERRFPPGLFDKTSRFTAK
jgi:hypothetical protein